MVHVISAHIPYDLGGYLCAPCRLARARELAPAIALFDFRTAAEAVECARLLGGCVGGVEL